MTFRLVIEAVTGDGGLILHLEKCDTVLRVDGMVVSRVSI
jgi:hypothetical protein